MFVVQLSYTLLNSFAAFKVIRLLNSSVCLSFISPCSFIFSLYYYYMYIYSYLRLFAKKENTFTYSLTRKPEFQLNAIASNVDLTILFYLCVFFLRRSFYHSLSAPINVSCLSYVVVYNKPCNSYRNVVQWLVD